MSTSNTRAYFGTDGIRGTVGQSPITADFMLRLGHAVGRVQCFFFAVEIVDEP